MLSCKKRVDSHQNLRATYSSVVEHLLMVLWVFESISHGGPIELFLIPANAP